MLFVCVYQSLKSFLLFESIHIDFSNISVSFSKHRYMDWLNSRITSIDMYRLNSLECLDIDKDDTLVKIMTLIVVNTIVWLEHVSVNVNIWSWCYFYCIVVRNETTFHNCHMKFIHRELWFKDYATVGLYFVNQLELQSIPIRVRHQTPTIHLNRLVTQ